MVAHDSKIIIVGAGVFGLSTALWLARSGYKDITIFDRCDVNKNKYNPSDGCDGASADINKVFRTAYGSQKEYQEIAFEARKMWLEWNQAIKEGTASDLPDGITPEDELLIVCGSYFLAEGPTLRKFYTESLEMMEKEAPDSRSLQFVKGDFDDETRLRSMDPKWLKKYHILDKINNGNSNGFIDIDAGINIADKACIYARYLCEKFGVNFVLGDPKGRLEELIVEDKGSNKSVIGIKTSDGSSHFADLVIVACGAWTASILPETHRLVEATAGTVMFIDVPKDRKDIWKKFHPDNFPVWSYRRGEGASYYQGGGFPITKEGRLKFGFRGQRFTNFQDHPSEANLRVSTPRTKYTDTSIHTVPLYGLRLMKEVISQAFPELKDLEFTDSRLCWYNDTFDDDFLIDYVPGYSESLFVCTGHGFKFLPNLGKYVKNQLEHRPDQFTKLWRWRDLGGGQDSNGLLEGETGPREMSKLQMANPAIDFKFQIDYSVAQSRL